MREAKGYGPEQAVEAQMPMGASADNIKGATGAGPKKAAQPSQKYGTVAEIVAHADDLTPKLRENILAFAERMETVRRLVTLRQDVDIELDLALADTGRFDPATAAPILDELGLKRLLDRVGASTGSQTPALEKVETAPPGAATLFDQATETTAGYELVDTEEALAALARKLANAVSFAFDTETTSLVAATADLVGISVSFEPNTGYYVPVRGVGRTVSEDVLRKHLGPIMADERIAKCGQNLKYDVVVLKTVGIEVRGIDFDTMVASFVLEPTRRSHGLDALALDLLHFRKIPTSDLIGKGKKQVTFDTIDTQRTSQYACEDSDVTWRLRRLFDDQLTDPELRSLFVDLEMPLVEVLADMEHAGVAVDTELLAGLSGQMADRLAQLEGDIHAAAGRPFNINSTQQLGEILFDELGLRVVRRTKTTRSTDAEVLTTLAAESNHPIPGLVLQHRELAKLKGTYVDTLPELVSERTGRIHPSFHQTGTVTGRLSCSDPNLQNIPIRTPMGAKIRRAFVPGIEGGVLIKADYSQIELRILAHLSGDEALMQAFHEDRDIHTFVAAQLAGIPIEEVTKDQRSRAKTVNFGIVYGQSAFGLARQTGMSMGDAKVFIARYFERYPQIRGFLDSCVQHARRHGYVKTMRGRRRIIPSGRPARAKSSWAFRSGPVSMTGPAGSERRPETSVVDARYFSWHPAVAPSRG